MELKAITRREAVCGAAAASALCSLAIPALADEPQDWDYQADFVVIGSGTGIAGALAAGTAGSVILVEKEADLGGTTKMSGGAIWAPLLDQEFDAGIADDEQTALTYMRGCDIYGTSTDEDKLDYIRNAKPVFGWMQDNVWEDLGIRFDIMHFCGDYWDVEGSLTRGRSWIPSFHGEQEWLATVYGEAYIPALEEAGATVLTGTRATRLVQREDGRVVGVVCVDGDGAEVQIGANKGVLLATGGFERNPQMCNAYLHGPLAGAMTNPGNTGDGHRMAMELGAAMGNMPNVWTCAVYVSGQEEVIAPNDYTMFISLPGAMCVNQAGRRFMNEARPYGAGMDLPFWNFDPVNLCLSNMPAYVIFDASVPETYAWPTFSSEMPSFVESFDTLEELALAKGIDPEGLADEVARFNAFCETGIDEDFGRCNDRFSDIGSNWVLSGIASLFGTEVDQDGGNPSLQPLVQPPFYVAQVGPGTYGTCGGMLTNADAQVLDLDGHPIEGLYACGNCSSAFMGASYVGAGASVGAGYYKALRAANHAMGLGML